MAFYKVANNISKEPSQVCMFEDVKVGFSLKIISSLSRGRSITSHWIRKDSISRGREDYTQVIRLLAHCLNFYDGRNALHMFGAREKFRAFTLVSLTFV